MPVLRFKLKNICPLRTRWKISSSDSRHHPVCLGYKSKRRYSRISCSLERKNVQGFCISRLRPDEFYSTESWRIGIQRLGGTFQKILRMHLVQIWIRERQRDSGGIIQKSELHERHPCALGVEEQPPEETSWQADCTSEVAWNLAIKKASLSRTLNNVLFRCEGDRDTEARMFIVYSGASMHNAEQGDLSSDTMDTLRGSKTWYATYRDREQCKWTSKHQFLFMISICS